MRLIIDEKMVNPARFRVTDHDDGAAINRELRGVPSLLDIAIFGEDSVSFNYEEEE